MNKHATATRNSWGVGNFRVEDLCRPEDYTHNSGLVYRDGLMGRVLGAGRAMETNIKVAAESAVYRLAWR